MDNLEIRELITQVQWHHSYEVVPGVTTPGVYNPMGLWKRLNLPASLAGLRVLDIGARDGFFSFACEERGAEVLAVDHIDKESTGFGIASRLRNSRVQYLHDNLYNLKPEKIGQFHIVLMLGVIYHVPDPIFSLEVVRSLCVEGAKLFVESTCIDDTAILPGKTADTAALRDLPVMVFVHRNRTSFWDLNSQCLSQLLEYADFRPQATRDLGKANAN